MQLSQRKYNIFCCMIITKKRLNWEFEFRADLTKEQLKSECKQAKK